MARRFLMGLDAGGGKGVCLLVDLESGSLISAARRWVHPAAPGIGEACDLDLNAIWRLLGDAIGEAMERAGATPAEIAGIAVTGTRHGVVLLDERGRALLASLSRDGGAVAEATELATEHGPAFYQRTGHWPWPAPAAARLRWLALNHPERLEQAHTLLAVSEWVTWRLCGEFAADPSLAGETLLFDLNGTWALDLAGSLGLPGGIFPRVVGAGTLLGTLTGSAARDLGLRPGIPVAVGGGDTQCGLLGAGCCSAGQLGIIAGTTTPLQLVVDRPLTDPAFRLWTGHHVVPGLWVLESNAGAMGHGLAWIARLLYPDAPDPAEKLSAEAAVSSAGAVGILSTVGTDVFNAQRRTAPAGNLTFLPAMAPGEAPQACHLARAILEGMACAVRANAEQILEVAGTDNPTQVAVAGGLSRSATWTQLVADVLGLPVLVAATPEASALGAAICAGVGAGVFGSLEEGSATLSFASRVDRPTVDQAGIYRRLYQGWSSARQLAAPSPSIRAAKGGAVNGLERTLNMFLSGLAADSAMRRFATGDSLAMHCVLTDAELGFHVLFRDGEATGGMGELPTPADVTCEMSAATFDGMMTGRFDWAQAATTGKLKFRGDASKVMAVQEIAREMGRLYVQVRETVGAPGHLAELARPAPMDGSPATAEPRKAPSDRLEPAAQGDERDEIVATVGELYAKELITATGGNVSARVRDQPEQVWITPSQMFKGGLCGAMIVRIDLEGRPLDADTLAPSSEKLMHAEIYRARPEINAIVHTHAPWATLLVLTETPFRPISTEAAFIGEIPRVAFIMPGTRELAEAVVQALGRQSTVVLMQNHGLVVVGSSLRRAANLSEVVERTAEMILRCRALGKEPPVLPEEAVRKLREIGHMTA